MFKITNKITWFSWDGRSFNKFTQLIIEKDNAMENLVHDMMSRKRILEENGFNVSESQVIEYEGKPLYGFSVKYPEQGDKVVELYDLFSALNFTNTYTTEHGWFIGCGTTLESVDEALNTEIEVQHNE